MFAIGYNRGYDDYLDGVDYDDCPYDTYGVLCEAWEDGWKDAAHDRGVY